MFTYGSVPLKEFNGRVVLIIGTLSGIGKQVAIDFANNGATALIFVARSVRSLRAANSPQLEITVPFYFRVAVWLKQTLPDVAYPIMGTALREKLK
jgi:hypothetical protein